MNENIQTNNLPQVPVETSAVYFDGYFDQPVYFTADEYSAISGAYKGMGLEDEVVKSLTFAAIKQAKLLGIDVLDMAKALQGQATINVNTTVGQVLNGSRNNTSSIGFRRTDISINPLIERLVRP